MELFVGTPRSSQIQRMPSVLCIIQNIILVERELRFSPIFYVHLYVEYAHHFGWHNQMVVNLLAQPPIKHWKHSRYGLVFQQTFIKIGHSCNIVIKNCDAFSIAFHRQTTVHSPLNFRSSWQENDCFLELAVHPFKDERVEIQATNDFLSLCSCSDIHKSTCFIESAPLWQRYSMAKTFKNFIPVVQHEHRAVSSSPCQQTILLTMQVAMEQAINHRVGVRSSDLLLYIWFELLRITLVR
mmetsp:Transcript_4785/g.10061  ORF Transcript_4785/g.10061 Transcript_4785/m.10061 type:complete len:240 (-) Transcript_4785:935-1654(-)